MQVNDEVSVVVDVVNIPIIYEEANKVYLHYTLLILIF